MRPTTTATELASEIRARRTSPVEAAQYYLDRIDRLDGPVNAIVWRDDERTLQEARAAERLLMTGGDLPPFLGVPIPVKELTNAAGQPNTLGSLGTSTEPRTHDDLVIAALRRAGGVLMGRSNTPEMGPMSVSDNRRFGRTANPWHLGRTAGGSSGGAAAAVAAGLAPAAQASDGGGSIRMPSSCCGTVGLKPSRGRVPAFVAAWDHGVVDGMITRSVLDAAALLDVISTPDPLSWYNAPALQRPLAEEVGRDPGRLRVGLLLEAPNGVPVDAESIAAAQRLAEELEHLGHHVFPAKLDGYSPVALREYLDVIVNAWVLATPYVDETLAEPYLQYRRDRGRQRSAGDYAVADARLQYETRAVNAQWGRDWDVLLTPTMATVAPPIGTVLEEANATPDGPRVTENQMIAFTAFANIAGLPAISLPVHRTGDGVPVGAQLIGGPFDEATLVRLASQVEPAFAWTEALPPGFD
ncbi:amidase [Quadrisphaera granulorum]|uniref:Amidase n=1 Tax=Quadrisphaera granulorum TaxID=317664 RepID=A0A315ZSN8_9ACTN|nr:amidase [Quadrisphaera granulorum]PWJ48292.1 amidase [Quadrisphaera granulorum]SZE98453.1 amidase [Quadrisphaera granulorum]